MNAYQPASTASSDLFLTRLPFFFLTRAALSPDAGRARRKHSSKFQCQNECLSAGLHGLQRNQIRASVSVARCARSPLRPCPFNLFSNTGRGIGTVVSRSDMDGRLSSER